MCAIKPAHKKRMILDVYTSDSTLSHEAFTEMVLSASLMMEMQLNQETKLRWHVKETEQEAA